MTLHAGVDVEFFRCIACPAVLVRSEIPNVGRRSYELVAVQHDQGTVTVKPHECGSLSVN